MGLWKQLKQAALAGCAAGFFSCCIITDSSEGKEKQVKGTDAEIPDEAVQKYSASTCDES